jgi:hypothetical protein
LWWPRELTLMTAWATLLDMVCRDRNTMDGPRWIQKSEIHSKPWLTKSCSQSRELPNCLWSYWWWLFGISCMRTRWDNPFCFHWYIWCFGTWWKWWKLRRGGVVRRVSTGTAYCISRVSTASLCGFYELLRGKSVCMVHVAPYISNHYVKLLLNLSNWLVPLVI